ncbi:MAG: hypothetical protein NT007_18595 [Candidatus Kapabacteria bacterium]|nr:hypothetical protein [Candidatus Kapabacteria bacterium]
MKKLSFLVFFFFLTVTAFSQIRVTVIPFINTSGNMKFNKFNLMLQDSLQKSFIAKFNGTEKTVFVPFDSVEAVLTGMNVDPSNPQYLSDMWKAIKKLNIQKVVSGDFNYEADKFLINASIIKVSSKLPDNIFKVQDLFYNEDKIFDCIKVIVDGLSGSFQ